MLHSIFISRTINSFLVLILIIVCFDTAKSQKTLLFDGLKLIGQSTQKVDEMFGKPVEIEPEKFPEVLKEIYTFDQSRHYKFKGGKFANYTKSGLVVRFSKGKAVGFNLDLPTPQKTAQAAMALIGIKIKDKKLKKGDIAVFLLGEFSGKYLVLTAYHWSNKNLFDLVEVTLNEH